jgi:large subunit ribosomal protein L15
MPLHMRVPKLKGFRNPFRTEYQVVNLDRLAELFPQGGEVTPEELAARGAVRAGKRVKILGQGEVGVVLRVSAHAFSDRAADKIAAAGGTVARVQ